MSVPRMPVETLLGLAQNAVDVGNLNAACEFYEIALVQHPNHADVYEAYAEIMLHYLQDQARAEQMLRHAIRVCPTEGHVKYLNLAQLTRGHEALTLYMEAYSLLMKDLAKARKKRKRASLKTQMSNVRTAAAELFLTDLCDEDGAENHCELHLHDAVALNPENIEAYQAVASLRISQDRLDEAERALDRAVELTHRLSEEHQPTYESKVELGKLLLQVSPEKSFRFLLEVLQLNDGNAYVWFLLGECARLKQKYEDSARLFKRARLVVDPSNAGALSEIDASIRLLVSEIGEDAVAQIPNMDHPNPLDFLDPLWLAVEENDEDIVDGDGKNDDAEPEWENVAEEDEED